MFRVFKVLGLRVFRVLGFLVFRFRVQGLGFREYLALAGRWVLTLGAEV